MFDRTAYLTNNKEMNMERRTNVRGVVCDDDGLIFAVKHRDHHDGTESQYWATLGGGLDPHETLHDGLVRESVEEVGIVPKIGRLLFIQQFIAYHRDGHTTEKMELFFHVENTEDYKRPIDLSSTTHGHELFRVGFVPPHDSFILPSFLHVINIRDFIDTNQPVLVVNNLDKPSQ